jgi:hypothetical protein
MGRVQREVFLRLVRERFDWDISLDEGHVLYRETIESRVEGVGHFEPLRHYAEVHLILEPLSPGSGLVFDSVCSEDALDRNWQRLILTHLAEKQHLGVLTGSPITDMKITLAAGRAHVKHTEGGDFREATYRAVRQGLMRARSVLLEPGCYYAYAELDRLYPWHLRWLLRYPLQCHHLLFRLANYAQADTFGICGQRANRIQRLQDVSDDNRHFMDVTMHFNNGLDSTFVFDVTDQVRRRWKGGVITVELDMDSVRLPTRSGGSAFDAVVLDYIEETHEFGL